MGKYGQLGLQIGKQLGNAYIAYADSQDREIQDAGMDALFDKFDEVLGYESGTTAKNMQDPKFAEQVVKQVQSQETLAEPGLTDIKADFGEVQTMEDYDTEIDRYNAQQQGALKMSLIDQLGLEADTTGMQEGVQAGAAGSPVQVPGTPGKSVYDIEDRRALNTDRAKQMLELNQAVEGIEWGRRGVPKRAHQLVDELNKILGGSQKTQDQMAVLDRRHELQGQQMEQRHELGIEMLQKKDEIGDENLAQKYKQDLEFEKIKQANKERLMEMKSNDKTKTKKFSNFADELYLQYANGDITKESAVQQYDNMISEMQADIEKRFTELENLDVEGSSDEFKSIMETNIKEMNKNLNKLKNNRMLMGVDRTPQGSTKPDRAQEKLKIGLDIMKMEKKMSAEQDPIKKEIWAKMINKAKTRFKQYNDVRY